MAKKKKSLAAQIKKESIETVNKMTAKEERKRIPVVYKTSARHVEAIQGVELSEDGFLLSIDDPFAEGALRTYKALTNNNNLCLPVLLPFKDSGTKAALDNYIIRASGGGDVERVKAARKAIEKIE